MISDSNFLFHLQIVLKLAPYKKLYDNCIQYRKKYEEWMKTKVGHIIPEEIDEETNTFYKNIYKLKMQFSHLPGPFGIASQVLDEVSAFRENMPIIHTLGNPGLQLRHWDKISETIGFPLTPAKEEITLERILKCGLEEYVPRFEIISDSATKENALEKKLLSMRDEWEELEFNVIAYR